MIVAGTVFTAGILAYIAIDVTVEAIRQRRAK